MPNTANFGVETPGAKVQGTLTDKQIAIPNVPPSGLLAIGNRTSFHFVEEPWNEDTTYHYYDVVKPSDEVPASYIAIKPVILAGTPLTDKSSWFYWSDPNIDVAELRKIVEGYEARFSTQDAKIDSNTETIATKAPISHADASTKYGIASNNNYGHVKPAQSIEDTSDGVYISPSIIKPYANMVSIEAYGCNSDSNTNSIALQNALDDAASKGITLFVPNKTYKCEQVVYIPSNTTLIGTGSQSKFLFTSTAGFSVRKDKNNYLIAHDVYISNISIFGSRARINVADGGSTNPQKYIATNAGIYGMYTACRFENIFIAYFEMGISLIQPVSNPDYNNLYNHIYGDIRLWRNICVDSCDIGINNAQSDTFFNTVAIQSSRTGYSGGYSVANMHIWGCNLGILAAKGWFTNIEVESQNCRTNNGDVIESFIVMNSNDNILFNNLHMWNALPKGNASVYHPYIRTDDNHSPNVCIMNLSIGADSKSPNTVKRSIIRGTHGNAIVIGAVCNTITSKESYVSTVTTGAGKYLTTYIYTNFEWEKGHNVSSGSFQKFDVSAN